MLSVWLIGTNASGRRHFAMFQFVRLSQVRDLATVEMEKVCKKVFT